MFALVSTMNSSSDVRGRILSVHKTPRAAGLADAKLQRRVRRENGQHSFIPTTCIIVSSRIKAGVCLYQGEGGTLNDAQVSEYMLADYNG